MTLCIGAVCDDGKKTDPKIILCADMERTAEGIGSSETEDKLGFVKRGWPTLVAGTISRANELIDAYAGYLKEHEAEINEFNLIDHLRNPAHNQKEKLVEEYLRQTYAFDREYFYGTGGTNLPQTFISTVTESISRIRLDSSLIIAGFLDETDLNTGGISRRPFLAVVDEVTDVSGSQGYVTLEHEFAAIGSGQSTALSSLYRREQDSTNSLRRSLYKVYEANRLSESVPGVGKEYIAMYILHSDGHVEELTKDGYDYLSSLYNKFGPQKIDSKLLSGDKDFFQPLNGAAKTIKRPPIPEPETASKTT
jgi:20S proteasome alpha/beta subunit